MKVLVTGARGLLGSAVMETLAETGHEATALRSDLCDAEAVLGEIAKVHPDVIVHAAALTSVAACEADPPRAQAVNAEGTKLMVEGASGVGARLIYISTVSVLNSPEGNGKEEDEPHPQNVYNRTKREGELAVLAYGEGMVLRINVMGVPVGGSRGKSFLEWLTDSLVADTDVSLYTDERVNPLSNWTLARYIGELIETPIPERILHLGSKDVLSKADIGRRVASRYPAYRGTLTDVAKGDGGQSLGQPHEMWLNVERAERYLGPMPTLDGELAVLAEHGALPSFP
jgi:dTDP-4-dehydrorhamnose reductase